jgi:iron complex outermembrane recepter protein
MVPRLTPAMLAAPLLFACAPAVRAQQSAPTDEILVQARAPRADAGITRPVGANQYQLGAGDWGDALSGNNALSLVKDLPGVAYTATDALGVDVSDTSLFVRGFHMNELAITFEGVPLNDTGFLGLTGTSLVNVGVPDAIGSIEVSPGTARESTFSSSDDGGGLVYALAPLKDSPTAQLKQAAGSNATFVTTLSAQTGRLGANGPRVEIDLQRIAADKYEGGGTQLFLRGDLKARQDLPWGDLTLFLSGSRAQVWGYDNLSFAMIRNLGWNADTFYPDYRQAYRDALPQNADAACGVYTCGALSFLVPYDTGQTTSDRIAALTHHFTLSSRLGGSVAVYGAHSVTFASLADPTTPSPSGAPFSEQVQNPRVTRYGVTANVRYVAGAHTLTGGLWVERATAAAITAWYNEPVLGGGAPLRTIGPWDVYGPAFQTADRSQWRTWSRQVYLHDDIALGDGLTLGAGFKGVYFGTVGGGTGPDRAPYGALHARADFLPHLSLMWKADARTDVFFDAAETEIGYRVAERGNIGYSASVWTVSDQQTFDTAVHTIRPETDWNATLGTAHRFGRINATFDLFYSRIDNRLLSAAVGSQFDQVYTVGDVPRMHILGSDLGINADLLRHVHLYQGIAVARSYYDADLTVAGSDFPIRGKAQPGYPIVSLVSDLSVKLASWQIGMTSTEYLDEPFSYENDIHVPNFWQANAWVAWTLKARGPRPALTLRLDVSNLFDRNNIGTATIGGSPFSGDYQTLQRTAPRQVLVSLAAKY